MSAFPSEFPKPELVELYSIYTGGPISIGASYTRMAMKQTANDALLAATATDFILYPGGGRPPSYRSFRLNNKGFKEITAVSHFGPALASLVNMHLMEPDSKLWRGEAERLVVATQNARKANSVSLWSDNIAVEAFRGREAAIAAMTDYSCAASLRYLHAVLDDESKLTPQYLRAAFFGGNR